MTQKKIPASVFIIVGAGMILMSVFVGINMQDIAKFSLFIFAGAIFILIGFFKIIIKQQKEAKHPHHRAHHPAHKAKHKPHKPAHKHHPHAKHPTAHHTQIIRCSNCHVKLHHMFKFCPNCGQKLK
jgi:ABC-type nickel/cobalt efflux system permease component RcnA